MKLPGALIFINNDLNEISLNTLTTQLHLTEVISKTEFDARLATNPDYPTLIKGFKYRVLVTLPSMQDITNREQADIVIFLKQGIASILKNNYGPHGLSYSIQRFNIYDLLRYNLSDEVKIYPNISSSNSSACSSCSSTCSCEFKQLFGTNTTNDVFCPNPDNILNNTNFKNRK